MWRLPDVDAYIGRAARFARPVLERVRELFQRGCPVIEERIRWGTPHFDYKGVMGGMAAFKAHVSVSFLNGAFMADGKPRSWKYS